MQFLGKLERLNAGERARLKRDAGKTLAEAGSLGLFYRLAPPGLSAREEEMYFLIASLYPLGAAARRGNLGEALRRARSRQNARGLDRRVEILLDADAAQFPHRLRQAVKYLRSNRVGVHWPELLEDALRWNSPFRAVQKRWARSYFGLRAPKEEMPPVIPTESAEQDS